jgi:MarR family transcriptional regulator, 2-MHQ and catechol-resistance regulon repressor
MQLCRKRISCPARHVRTLGLTVPQFDIIATLGNTEGMTFKQLGEKTLITKGTLTGVVDRLESRKIVRRVASSTDGRSQLVQLTPEGEKLFSRIFPAHLDYLGKAFADINPDELQQTQTQLTRLGNIFRLTSDI